MLELVGVRKRYPGVDVLQGVSFSALPGEVHALLGENGAGKSTLMGIAAASVEADDGNVVVGGERMSPWTPALARRHGVAMVYQHPALLPDLTVAENLQIALSEQIREQGRGARAWMQDQLELIGCSAPLSARVDEISVAQRQLVELAKALALEPRVLILDEPTAPLGLEMVNRMFTRVREATARDVAVVYISHRLPEVREIADVVTVMRDGEVRKTAPMNELSDDEILRLIIGRTVSTAFPPKRTKAPDGGAALSVQDLSGQGFTNVSLDVQPGEIVGLAGIAGNGQSDVLRALAGLESASGQVRLGDRTLPLGRAHKMHASGVAYLPSDRHNEGLEMTLSVRENAVLSSLPQFASHGLMSRRREQERVDRIRDSLNIRTATTESPVSALSGGNQQKVVLARALLAEPALILAEEPTQGVDAGARIEIYRILRDVAESGIPMVLVVVGRARARGLCDRILVFSRGEVIAELAGEDVNEANMARAIVTATTHRRHEEVERRVASSVRRSGAVRRFARGDYAPALALLAVIVALRVLHVRPEQLGDQRLQRHLDAHAARGAGVHQPRPALRDPDRGDRHLGGSARRSRGRHRIVLRRGREIDPRRDRRLRPDARCRGSVGAFNGTLDALRWLHPIAATLTVSIALQGVSLLLRPEQGGYIRIG